MRGENVHVRQDGRELHVESSITVLRETVGQPAGVLAVIRDICGRKLGRGQSARFGNSLPPAL